ncbi:8-oxo-dGTP diphosphatase [Levilactobacillus tujiorum]|uniref:8-oxo-dGTP diphosphatase n=1 Tax=Levilactobacillus tujiorum TaxID=2912243 RepID=UPI001456FEE6|nr:NUDIX domain-containing protein [Levilactobacillus tujiorum]NLR32469.1 NUDIX domain-containing protein [Levilactobacillus tujiorum]
MTRTQAVELVTMVMVTDPATGKVLVEDKVNVPWKAGHSFPGGHVEVGESCAAAAIREVFEEAGLALTSVDFCGTCEWFSADRQQRKLGLLYRGDQFTGTIKASAEGPIYWLDPTELTAENSAESLLTLLKVFRHEVAAVTSDDWNGQLQPDPSL